MLWAGPFPLGLILLMGCSTGTGCRELMAERIWGLLETSRSKAWADPTLEGVCGGAVAPELLGWVW